jgi:hypothetical protein
MPTENPAAGPIFYFIIVKQARNFTKAMLTMNFGADSCLFILIKYGLQSLKFSAS